MVTGNHDQPHNHNRDLCSATKWTVALNNVNTVEKAEITN